MFLFGKVQIRILDFFEKNKNQKLTRLKQHSDVENNESRISIAESNLTESSLSDSESEASQTPHSSRPASLRNNDEVTRDVTPKHVSHTPTPPIVQVEIILKIFNDFSKIEKIYLIFEKSSGVFLGGAPTGPGHGEKRARYEKGADQAWEDALWSYNDQKRILHGLREYIY